MIAPEPVQGHRVDVQRAILAAVASQPGVKTVDLDIRVYGGTPPEAVSRAVSAMVKAGHIHREGRGRLYPVTEDTAPPASGVFTADEAERLEVHPLAELSPPMTPAEEAELAASIAFYGMHDPIELLDGKILDGRHRRKVAVVSGSNVPWKVWRPPEPDHPPELWVLAKNAHRRHLTPTQRAVLAAEAKRLLDARGATYSKVVGWSEPRATSERQVSDSFPAASGETSGNVGGRPSSTAIVARGYQTSPDSVERAERVLDYGADELVEVARSPQPVGIATLAKVAELPFPAQRAAVAGGPEGLREAARQVGRQLPTGVDASPPGQLDASHLQDGNASPAGEHDASPEDLHDATDTDVDADIDGDLPDDERAENDAYYTPLRHALAICRWLALRIPAPRTILEPAAGGGNWVTAARQVWPKARIDRWDIDPDAWGLCEDLRPDEHAEQGDFRELAARAADAGKTWDLVLGNPPYTGDLRGWVQLSMALAVHGVGYLLLDSFTGAAARIPWFTGEGRPRTICKTLPRPTWEGPGKRGSPAKQDSVTILWPGQDGPRPTRTDYEWFDIRTEPRGPSC